MAKFKVGQRVEIVNTEMYVLLEDMKKGTVVDVNYQGIGRIEVVIDNYTTEEPFAGGWDTLAFAPSSLKIEEEN